MHAANFDQKQLISRGTQTSSQAIVHQSGRVLEARQQSSWQGHAVVEYPKPSENPCVEDFDRCCKSCTKVLEKIIMVAGATCMMAANPPLTLAVCGIGYL